MARLTLSNVVKRYPGGSNAVSELSLEIADGEFLSLVGPSGCGKSTTLNLIAGLETPSSGEIRIDGQLVNHLEPVERDVAMVFQSYALYPHLTVAQNLAFPLKLRRVPSAELEARVNETAAKLGISELLPRKPAQLSGGQRQRVALGRAMVRRPRLFLFDEPLSNLDPGLRGQMRAEIKRLHQELEATFVYVTHDQQEAMTLSDRIALLDRGVLQQVGSPRELYERPRCRFVAEFFGTPRINLLPASWVGGAPGAQVGLRPEHLEVLTSEAIGAPPARILLVEPVGAESWVTAELEGHPVIARAPGDFAGRPGDTIWLRLDPTRAIPL